MDLDGVKMCLGCALCNTKRMEEIGLSYGCDEGIRLYKANEMESIISCDSFSEADKESLADNITFRIKRNDIQWI